MKNLLLLPALASCLTIKQNRQLWTQNSTSTSATVNLWRPGDIPNPFVHNFDVFWRIEVRHGGGGHRHPELNPGVSVYNWAAAMGHVGLAALKFEKEVHLSDEDLVPGNKFEHEDPLARPASRHALHPRRTKFEIKGQSEVRPLRFEDVHLAVLGLFEYQKIWERGSKNDQVRMCQFEIQYVHNRNVHSVSQGSVVLVTS